MIPLWVNKYVGIPYKLHSASLNTCDCYGLVCLIYKDIFDIVLPDYHNNYGIDSNDQIINDIYSVEKEKWIEVNNPDIGDVIYFIIAGQPKHVGLVVGDGKFIHNLTAGGSSAIGTYTNVKWKKRILGFYRHAKNNL